MDVNVRIKPCEMFSEKQWCASKAAYRSMSTLRLDHPFLSLYLALVKKYISEQKEFASALDVKYMWSGGYIPTAAVVNDNHYPLHFAA